MEAVMWAVNKLKGNLSNCYNGACSGAFLFVDTDDYEYLLCDARQGNDICLSYVCNISEFISRIGELSHAAWIKGPSLAEYQAAIKTPLAKKIVISGDGGKDFTKRISDKISEYIKHEEVLKVGNKTVEVEIDSEFYQLEKDYEFKSCGDKYWVNGRLDNVRSGGELRFASNGFWWKWCRAIDKSNIGTITPAPVKLVDGAVYLVDVECGLYKKKRVPLTYSKSDDEFFTVGCCFSVRDCTNITSLVQEVK